MGMIQITIGIRMKIINLMDGRLQSLADYILINLTLTLSLLCLVVLRLDVLSSQGLC